MTQTNLLSRILSLLVAIDLVKSAPCKLTVYPDCKREAATTTYSASPTNYVLTERRSWRLEGDCRATFQIDNGCTGTTLEIISTSTQSVDYYMGGHCPDFCSPGAPGALTPPLRTTLNNGTTCIVGDVSWVYSGPACVHLYQLSAAPTPKPSPAPTVLPSFVPTNIPSINPSFGPSSIPTFVPSFSPSSVPTTTPSQIPSFVPSSSPSSPPSMIPSQSPSGAPSSPPSSSPSQTPTTTKPTPAPSSSPSFTPSNAPSSRPTQSPSSVPSFGPSSSPSTIPTNVPTVIPTNVPTMSPSIVPSMSPTSSPTYVRCSFLISINVLNGPRRFSRWNNRRCTPDQRLRYGRRRFRCQGNIELSWEVPDHWVLSGPDPEDSSRIVRFLFYIYNASRNSLEPPYAYTWSERIGRRRNVTIVLTCATASSALTLLTNEQAVIRNFVQGPGFVIVAIGMVAVLVTAILAKVAESRHRGGDKLGGGVLSFPSYFLQVLDLMTDVLFTLTLMGARPVLFWTGTAFLVIPYGLGWIVLFMKIAEWRRDPVIRQWLNSNTKFLILLYTFSGSFTRVVSLANSKIFYHNLFDMGLRPREIDELSKFRLIPVVLENMPQMVIQIIYYTTKREATDIIVFAAFFVTTFSFLMSFMFGVARFRDRHTPYDPEDFYEHFCIVINCSSPRAWYKCSRKNVAQAIAQFVFDGKSPERVEVYDARVDSKHGKLYFAGVIAWPGEQDEFDNRFTNGEWTILMTQIRAYLRMTQRVRTTIESVKVKQTSSPNAMSIRSHFGVTENQRISEMMKMSKMRLQSTSLMSMRSTSDSNAGGTLRGEMV